MKVIFAFLILLVNAVRLHSQNPAYPKDETFKFLFFEGLISDTNKLNLKISYTNAEKDTILIPLSLIEGTRYEPYANVYTELQK